MILASYSHMAVATPSATRSVGLGRSLMANLDRGWTFAGPPGSEETASTRRPRGEADGHAVPGDERSGGHAVGSTPAASESPSPPAPADQSGNC